MLFGIRFRISISDMDIEEYAEVVRCTDELPNAVTLRCPTPVSGVEVAVQAPFG